MWRETGLPRVYVRKCAGTHSVGRSWKSWIDIMKGCLRKRGLDVRQGRKMLHDKSEWLGFEPLTLMRCHSYMKPLKDGSLSVAEPTT